MQLIVLIQTTFKLNIPLTLPIVFYDICMFFWNLPLGIFVVPNAVSLAKNSDPNRQSDLSVIDIYIYFHYKYA